MPTNAVKKVYAAISSESVLSGQLALFPCQSAPTFSLKFGDVVYDMPASAFSYG